MDRTDVIVNLATAGAVFITVLVAKTHKSAKQQRAMKKAYDQLGWTDPVFRTRSNTLLRML